MVLLADNVTIFSVIRKDGGDGYPSHPHVPYLLAKSTDGGVRWTIREAPHTMMSARPRMVALSNGALVVAGGRPALNLWVSLDSGETFSTYDIPTLHNQNMKNSEDRFCDAFEDANMSLGWAESSCYTQVLALSDDRAMICYERQGRGSSGYNHITTSNLRGAIPPTQHCTVCAFRSNVRCSNARTSGVGIAWKAPATSCSPLGVDDEIHDKNLYCRTRRDSQLRCLSLLLWNGHSLERRVDNLDLQSAALCL